MGCAELVELKLGCPWGPCAFMHQRATVNHQHTGISLSHPSNIRGSQPAFSFPSTAINDSHHRTLMDFQQGCHSIVIPMQLLSNAQSVQPIQLTLNLAVHLLHPAGVVSSHWTSATRLACIAARGPATACCTLRTNGLHVSLSHRHDAKFGELNLCTACLILASRWAAMEVGRTPAQNHLATQSGQRMAAMPLSEAGVCHVPCGNESCSPSDNLTIASEYVSLLNKLATVLV